MAGGPESTKDTGSQTKARGQQDCRVALPVGGPRVAPGNRDSKDRVPGDTDGPILTEVKLNSQTSFMRQSMKSEH